MPIGSLLAHLLLTAVNVADIRIHIGNLFAVQLDSEMKYTVGRWVMRTHINEHRIGVDVTIPLNRIFMLTEGDNLRFFRIVIAAKRVALPGFRKEDPPHIRVFFVFDPYEIVRLTLVPLGRPIDERPGFAYGVVAWQRHDDGQFTGPIVVTRQVIDRLVTALILLGGYT
jgi:hypothetical protein